MWIMWILEGLTGCFGVSVCVWVWYDHGVNVCGNVISFTPCWVSGARAIGSSVQALTSCTFEDWTGRVGASEARLFLLNLGISCSVAWVGWGLCAGASCGKLLELRLLEKHRMLSYLIRGLAFQSKTWPLRSWPVSAQILTGLGAYWKNPGQPWPHSGHPPPDRVLSLWLSVTMCPDAKSRWARLSPVAAFASAQARHHSTPVFPSRCGMSHGQRQDEQGALGLLRVWAVKSKWVYLGPIPPQVYSLRQVSLAAGMWCWDPVSSSSSVCLSPRQDEAAHLSGGNSGLMGQWCTCGIPHEGYYAANFWFTEINYYPLK